MGVFGNLNTNDLEQVEDRIGAFSPLESDAYDCTIKAAYAGQSSGGAQSLTLVVDAGGREYSETLYVTNKRGENFYLNPADKSKKVPLPGFVIAEHLCLVTCDKPLSAMVDEDKVMNIYDFDQGKQVPKSVPMLTELIGKQVCLGIIRQTVNKNEKQADGSYAPTAATRDENFTDKVFHLPTRLTVAEAQSGQTEPKFYEAWVARNKGQTRDKRVIKDGEGAAPGRPTRQAGPPTAGAPAAATKSLFGNKA